MSFQPQPGAAVAHYDRKQTHDHQTSPIPQVFREAMSVREEVYVTGQGVPIEGEFDDDDARSFHWVIYASVGNTAKPFSHDGSPDITRRASESTASRVAIGTIRLVPPPHAPHPAPENKIKTTDGTTNDEPPRSDSVASVISFEPDEPYIKLGRLAVLEPYRKLGLSKLLINAALTWAKEHPVEILPLLSPAEEEAARVEGKKDKLPWSGLMLVHSQAGAQHLWQRYGFIKDQELGSWDEEGIEHIGMWGRVDVNPNSRKSSLQAQNRKSSLPS